MEKLNEVEILLVEDNPYDAELTLRALQKKGLANKLLTFPDGVEALDFLFGTGEYVGRNLMPRPKVCSVGWHSCTRRLPSATRKRRVIANASNGDQIHVQRTTRQFRRRSRSPGG